MGIAPFFEKPPSIINKPDGSVLFECMCNGNPEPKVQVAILVNINYNFKF